MQTTNTIARHARHQVIQHLFKGKAIIILGARQVGKTTLMENILKGLNRPVLSLNGDEADVRELLGKYPLKEYIYYYMYYVKQDIFFILLYALSTIRNYEYFKYDLGDL